jgi:hypothetical protein
MDPLKKLESISGKAPVFMRGFLSQIIVDEGICLLRDAQVAGVEELQLLELECGEQSISVWSRKLREMGVVVYVKTGKSYQVTISDSLIVLIENFLETSEWGTKTPEELQEEKKVIPDDFDWRDRLKVRVTHARKLPPPEWAAMMDAFKQGKVDMMFFESKKGE